MEENCLRLGKKLYFTFLLTLNVKRVFDFATILDKILVLKGVRSLKIWLQLNAWKVHVVVRTLEPGQ